MARKRGADLMPDGKIEEIPINMEILSSDNRVGVLLGAGCLLFGVALSDLLEWSLFFQPDGWVGVVSRPLLLIIGGVLISLCGQRLLIPGCKPLLRINFGGVTDIRLLTAPLRWSFIVDAYRPRGIWYYLLPGVVLELSDGGRTGLETFWSRLIHLPCRLLGRNLLFLECGTLDHPTREILEAVRSHVRSRGGPAPPAQQRARVTRERASNSRSRSSRV
ncbi:MAG: hypothetical protein HQM02_02570 [Magnetococcales bacterium]|nr:hypothetical protein [Magnetococcales bacterium]